MRRWARKWMPCLRCSAHLRTDSPKTMRAARLTQAGPNQLQRQARRSVLRQFQNVLLYVLLGAAVITALLTQCIDRINR